MSRPSLTPSAFAEMGRLRPAPVFNAWLEIQAYARRGGIGFEAARPPRIPPIAISSRQGREP